MLPGISLQEGREEFPFLLPSWPSHSILSFVSTHPTLREGESASRRQRATGCGHSQEDTRDVMAPGVMPSWILFLSWPQYAFLSHPHWKFYGRSICTWSGETAGEARRISISGFPGTEVIWMLSRENQPSAPSWSILGHLESALMAWLQDQQI